jgi:hypothetical protein
VHAARGSDEEGAAALHEAAGLAEPLGDRASAALAHRELGYVDLLRGLGLVAAGREQVGEAAALLDDAPRRCRRLPDAYLWIEAYALEALAAFAVDHTPQTAMSWIEGPSAAPQPAG